MTSIPAACAAVLTAALAAAVAAPSTAAADGWGGEVGVATDFVSKAVTKSEGDPRVWGEVQYERGAAYAGASASTVKLSPGGDSELELFAGYKPEALGFEFDLSATYKYYPGTRDGLDDSMWEFRVDAERDLGPVETRLRVEYTPDNYGSSREAWWYEARGRVKIASRTRLFASVGARDLVNGPDYTGWGLGVTHKLTDAASLEIGYWDTDRHELGDRYQDRFAASLKYEF